LNNQAWYQQRGVPYTLGFLFYGPPGTGKTSTIKAIANYTKRHLVEISLSRIKTYKELQKVFHDTLFCEKTIPHSKMIYLIEDIDCLDDIVKQRQTGDVPEVLKKKKKEKDEEGSDSENSETEDAIAKNLNEGMKLEYAFFKSQMKAWNKDPVTLSHILNLIDGLLECHGRILVITTNHPEKLDSALIRPGRVDMRVNFDVCSREDTVNIVEMFFEKKVPTEVKESLYHKKHTAAEVYQICFQSVSAEKALSNLTMTHDEKEGFLEKSLKRSGAFGNYEEEKGLRASHRGTLSESGRAKGRTVINRTITVNNFGGLGGS